MPEPEEPTSAEWKVLTVVWERGSVAARDVLEALSDETGWSASTVKTPLRRLVEKGHLVTEPVGSSFLHSPARPPLRTLRRSAEALMGRAAEGAVGPLLAHLVRRRATAHLGHLLFLVPLLPLALPRLGVLALELPADAPGAAWLEPRREPSIDPAGPESAALPVDTPAAPDAPSRPGSRRPSAPSRRSCARTTPTGAGASATCRTGTTTAS